MMMRRIPEFHFSGPLLEYFLTEENEDLGSVMCRIKGSSV